MDNFFEIIVLNQFQFIVAKKIVCYLSGWSNYRSTRGKFTIDHIDPYLCTHIVYTFAGLDINGGIISLDIENDITRNSK